MNSPEPFRDSPSVLRVGKLNTRTTTPVEALSALRRQAGQLRACVRRGSNAQWFAVLEDGSGTPVASSDAFADPDTALDAAREALSLLRPAPAR